MLYIVGTMRYDGELFLLLCSPVLSKAERWNGHILRLLVNAFGVRVTLMLLKLISRPALCSHLIRAVFASYSRCVCVVVR